MIKLSDYLNYLNSEIIQARKKADEAAVEVAKQYAEHSYLKFFKVPRYSIPLVKMDIPLKVANIDQDNKYDFKIREEDFLEEVNNEIKKTNKEKGLQIKTLPLKQVTEKDGIYQAIFKELEKRDQYYGRETISTINKTNIGERIKDLKIKGFTTQEGATEEENEELKRIVTNSLLSHYKLVDVRLNELYIDPDATVKEDENSMFINLHVQMEEEGIRLIVMEDANGKKIEQISFE